MNNRKTARYRKVGSPGQVKSGRPVWKPATVRKPPSENNKGPGLAGAFEAGSTVAYFSEFEIVTKLLDSLLPTPLTAVMMAIAMPAAIRPYSMAVAPDSSFTKRETRFFIRDN